jgi:asparagine synthase (glutamine-hydrolysing)
MAAMLHHQAHRGPNHQGIVIEHCGAGGACIALGHRRLSIIDLSELGNQPMVHERTGDSLVFNGEIYNFRSIRDRLRREGESFASDSDTEVLLKALVRWGPGCIKDLAGMFAFAFHERKGNRVLLCRDGVGIKPLYTSFDGSTLVAASEVRAVLASGLVDRRISRAGVATMLAYGAPQEPLTIFDGIESFPAGCMRWYTCGTKGTVRAGPMERYWNLPSRVEIAGHEDSCKALDGVLSSAMREHLIADVPLGVFLSSGIDSTVMAGLAREINPLTRTFTLGFLDQADLSENELARSSARALRIEHHDIQVTDDQAASQALRWIETLDQPSVDGLNTYMISKAVRDAGIVVAISGLGGDELFGGYTLFQDIPRMLRLGERARWIPPGLRSKLVRLAALSQDAEVRWKFRGMTRLGNDLMRVYLMRRRANSDTRMQRLGLSHEALGLDESYQDARALECVRDLGDDVFAAIARLESKFYMRSVLLRDTDATSMAHSLEVRVPLLDRRVVDFAMALPGSVRSPQGLSSKHMLRAAFSRFLCKGVRGQAKRGFVLPISRWMRSTMRDMCEESMKSLAQSGLVEARESGAIWDEFLARPDSRMWSRAFQMCVLGAFVRNAERLPARVRPKPARVA